MAKKKYYVVWEGRSCGVYNSWADCLKQVKEFPNAKYRGYATFEAATLAFQRGYSASCDTSNVAQPHLHASFEVQTSEKKPVYPSLAVDAACSGVPGPMEYRGVEAHTGKELFHKGIFPDATNNVGEFLAIVHALALLQQQGLNTPIYSDSITAISWVRKKKANTSLIPTPKNVMLFDLIQRAEGWLKSNTFKNPILKWDTAAWGEIPADFGRK